MREKSWQEKHSASFGATVMYSVDKKMSQFIKITFIKLLQGVRASRCKDFRSDNLIKLDSTNFSVTVC